MRQRTSTSKPDTTPEPTATEPPVETTEVPGAALPGRRRRGPAAAEPSLEAEVSGDKILAALEAADHDGDGVHAASAPHSRRGPLADAENVLERMVEEGLMEPVEAPDEVRANLDVRNRKKLAMGSGFDAILDTIFEFDAADVYARIKKSLKLSMRASRAEYGMLVDALDDMAELSSEALQCVANANVAAQRVELEAQVIEAAMREQAVTQLANDGKLKPTIADIEAHMVSTFHDEVRSLRERRAAVKQTATMFEGLARVVSERQKDLRQMVASARQTH